ncbi:MAG: hypothetical protein QOG43_787 [Actinomycetota bacterium]|nr:hypothetical protein [Actinomycetota bacterium]
MLAVRRLLVAVAVVAMVGCGGGGGSGSDQATITFEDERFGITFDYPDDFRLGEVTDVVRTAGGSSTATQGVGIDDDNAIFLSRYELSTEVGKDNLDEVQTELDGVVRELVGKDVSGRRTKVGGLIAFTYDGLDVTPPTAGRSDLLFVFDGDVQYQLNCQSTPTHRSRMDDACNLARDTLSVA